MRISRLTNAIQGYQIISTSNGRVIGEVEDLLIDPKKLEVAAVITSKGNLLDSTIKAISREDILVWGEDFILAGDPDIIHDLDSLEGSKEWQTVTGEIKGKDVLNTRKEKIAELNDIVINSEAQIIGYDLSKVLIDGPVKKSKRIHTNTTKDLGKDSLIIDETNLYQWEI
jgi:sporulation protein YlmC with PRC-barrel domain